MIRVAHGFEPARVEDDPAIRALLCRTPMEGSVRLALEREPDFSLGCSIEGERTHVFVLRAREHGGILGLAQRSVSSAWIDGEPRRLGYLSHLRRDRELAVTRGLLASGFAACESTRAPGELSFDLTSILEENRSARRLLERGLPGLPAYEPLCRFVTLLLETRAVRRGARARKLPLGVEIRRATRDDTGAVARFLQETLALHPLAPVWTEDDLCSPLRARNLALERFRLAERGGRIIGCLALWDQRRFKQTVVRSYAGVLALARPWLAPVQRLLGRPGLPPPGTALPLAFLSHAAVRDQDARVLLALIDDVARSSDCAGLEHLVLGFAAANPLAGALRRALRPRELGSILYLVHPAGSRSRERLGPGVPHVEVARL